MSDPVRLPPSPSEQVRRFRDLFFGCLNDPAVIDSGRHALLAWLPEPSLLEPPAGGGVDAGLSAIDRSYAALGPADLYRNALDHPPNPVPRSDIEGVLTRVPVTVVAFPGIFGEFVNVLPFEEVARTRHSAFAREWDRLLEQYRASHTPAEVERTLFEEHFSLGALRLDPAARPVVRRPLGEMFGVGSIDDPRGNPLARVVVLRHHLDSLETVGSLEAITPVLSARLEKLFAVIGLPANLVLLGYSMGAPVVLDIVAKARSGRAAWLDRLRAVITVGGVVWGTHLADAVDGPPDARGNGMGRQLRLLERLADGLEETAPYPLVARGKSKLSVWWANLGLWRRLQPEIEAVVADLTRGGPALPLRDLLRLLRRSDFAPTLSLAINLATRTLRLHAPAHYSLNIRKFKRLVAGVRDGVDNLTTAGRLGWWQRHALPTKAVRYYAIAGSMPGNATDQAGRLILRNPDTYAYPSFDDLMLAQGHADYVALSNQALNDSQVAVSRARFWPKVSALANPYYTASPLDARFLGVLGTHHWGLVLPEVNQLEGDLKNPFPRSALLTALAAQVAFDLDQGG